MTIHTIRLLPILALYILFSQIASAQSPKEDAAAKASDLEKRLAELRRQELDVIRQLGELSQQVPTKKAQQKKETGDRKEDTDDWNKKYRPTIELRAKLESRSMALPVLPARVYTTWTIKIDGQVCLLRFRQVAEPVELREEQGVEVLIKGKLSTIPIPALDDTFERMFLPVGPVVFMIDVESLKKADKD